VRIVPAAAAIDTQAIPQVVASLRDRTRAFIREVVVPQEPVPGERLHPEARLVLQAAAKAAGVFAPHLREELGGPGLPLEWWSPVFQEAGYSPIGPTVLNCMAPDEGNMHMLDAIGTEEQKARFLFPLARGEVRSCFGMTEPHPGAGSDPAALQTRATRHVDGGWLIRGHKRFISGANGAAFCIVMARTGSDQGRAVAATMFLVPMDAPGVRIGQQIGTIDRYIEGGHPHVHFDEVRVPDSWVLGEPGQGFRYAQVRLGPARLTHCMRWLGLARRSLDIALDRAQTREMFGSPMKDLGLAQGLIADSVIDIETSDAIITKTARLMSADPRAGSALSSVAKVHCSDAIYRVIDRAIQMCGGDGVSDGLPLAQFLNEVRPFRIYDGSNETHKWAISRRASAARLAAIGGGEQCQGIAQDCDHETQ
jgi:acyl-CoA dehydrogenase